MAQCQCCLSTLKNPTKFLWLIQLLFHVVEEPGLNSQLVEALLGFIQRRDLSLGQQLVLQRRRGASTGLPGCLRVT